MSPAMPSDSPKPSPPAPETSAKAPAARTADSAETANSAPAEPLVLADSHSHLEFPQFDEDREQVFERAWLSGVRHLVAIGSGTGPHRLRAGFEMSEGRDWVYPTIGIHPHEAKLATDAHFIELEELAKDQRVIAVGEIGLDYHYDHSPRDVQTAVFRRQLDLAERNRLPVIIHCREAWPDCLTILEEQWKPTGLGGIFHCFSGTWDDARRGIDAGFYVSFAGTVTFPKAADLREVAALIPWDRLLIETDCPFLAPVPKRGKRNEPAFVQFVAEQIAKVREISASEAAAATTRNFLAFLEGVRTRRAAAGRA